MNRFYNTNVAMIAGSAVGIVNTINVPNSPQYPHPEHAGKIMNLLFWSASKGAVYGVFYPLGFVNIARSLQNRQLFNSHFIPGSKYVV